MRRRRQTNPATIIVAIEQADALAALGWRLTDEPQCGLCRITPPRVLAESSNSVASA